MTRKNSTAGATGAAAPAPHGRGRNNAHRRGRLRSRPLAGPKAKALGPPPTACGGAVQHPCACLWRSRHGARVLDLFAGTGALGFEAISRGAAYALFVDEGVEARALLRDNVETLGLGGVTRIFRRDATRLGPVHPLEPFTLAFADPPMARLGRKSARLRA